jgi:hypothetical protein
LGDLPQEASSNLKVPEIPLEEKKKEKSDRLRPLGIKVSNSFFRALRILAAEKDVFITDIIVEAVNEYKNKEKIPFANQQLLQELKKRIEEGNIFYLGDGKLVADNDEKNALYLGNIKIEKNR